MEQFSDVIFATLPIFCITLILFFRRPLYATVYFLVYRSIFSVAAYLHIPGLAGIPFFVPAFVMLWIVFGLYYIFISAKLPPILPIFILAMVCISMFISAAFFTVFRLNQTSNFGTTILKFILPIVIYLGAYTGLDTEEDFQKLPYLISLFLIIPILIGILQSITGISYDYSTDQFVSGMRPVGTIIDPNAYGIFLCMGAFIVVPFAIPNGRIGMKLLLVVIVMAVLLSKNRGSWICAVAATTIGIVMFRRYFNIPKVLGLASILALVAAPVMFARFADLNGRDQFGQSQDTFSERMEQSKHLLAEAALAPLTGYGAGSAEQPWGSSTISRPPHNDYVRMIYEYGIPISLMYIFFLFNQLHIAVHIRSVQNWPFGFSATCFIIYLILISLVQNIIYDTIMYSTIMFTMAIFHRKKHLSNESNCLNENFSDREDMNFR
jgi:hypothetical protein